MKRRALTVKIARRNIFSVALSADGSIAIANNRITWAAWVHTRNCSIWTPIVVPSPGL